MEYTNLDVWIESRKLTNLVYNATKKYQKKKFSDFKIKSEDLQFLFPQISQKVAEEIQTKKQYIFCLSQEVHYMNWKHSCIYLPTKIT